MQSLDSYKFVYALNLAFAVSHGRVVNDHSLCRGFQTVFVKGCKCSPLYAGNNSHCHDWSTAELTSDWQLTEPLWYLFNVDLGGVVKESTFPMDFIEVSGHVLSKPHKLLISAYIVEYNVAQQALWNIH